MKHIMNVFSTWACYVLNRPTWSFSFNILNGINPSQKESNGAQLPLHPPLRWGARVNSRPCTLLWSYIPCPEPNLCVYPHPCNRVSYIPSWRPKWSFCVYFLRTNITGMSQTCLVYVVQEFKPQALCAAQALYQLSSISRHELSILEGKYIEDSEDTWLRYKVELKLLGVSLHLLARCAEGCRNARTYQIWVVLLYLTTRTRIPISFYTSQH